MATEYGLRIGSRMIVLNAGTDKEAEKEITDLFGGPIELCKTNYVQKDVGVDMESAKILVKLSEEGDAVLVGEYEPTAPVLISENTCF